MRVDGQASRREAVTENIRGFWFDWARMLRVMQGFWSSMEPDDRCTAFPDGSRTAVDLGAVIHVVWPIKLRKISKQSFRIARPMSDCN